jgi:hypothetical protein
VARDSASVAREHRRMANRSQNPKPPGGYRV